MTTMDHVKRVALLRAAEAAHMRQEETGVCTLDRCICPTCDTTQMLLRSALMARKLDKDTVMRVTIRANDFRGSSYPYIATVRVDDAEVYRIIAAPDEVFEPDVMADILTALKKEKL